MYVIEIVGLLSINTPIIGCVLSARHVYLSKDVKNIINTNKYNIVSLLCLKCDCSVNIVAVFEQT